MHVTLYFPQDYLKAFWKKKYKYILDSIHLLLASVGERI